MWLLGIGIRKLHALFRHVHKLHNNTTKDKKIQAKIYDSPSYYYHHDPHHYLLPISCKWNHLGNAHNETGVVLQIN